MKAVIFDMDGVLINTEPLHYECWREVLREEGIEMDFDTYKPCIGSTREYLLEIIWDNYGKIGEAQDLMDRMKRKRREILNRDGFPLLPGVPEAIRKFRDAGYLLAVASSSPVHAIEEVLDVLGIHECFTSITSGNQVEHPKPAPDTFLCAMKKLGFSPEDCLVVEDSTNGGKAAKAAGMKCVWYHNPDSGDQSIPHAELEISEWNSENTDRILNLLKKYK